MTDPLDLLPLTPTVVHILVALAAGPRHGYRLMKDVAHLSDGVVRPGPGTLYGAIQRMTDQGLIEGAASKEGVDGEGSSGRAGAQRTDAKRRRAYAMTALGRRTLRAECERLGVLIARTNELQLWSEGDVG